MLQGEGCEMHTIPDLSGMSSTGELLDIERVTSSSEGGRWKSTHRGNSLAAYPTASTVRGGGHAIPERVNGPYSTKGTVNRASLENTVWGFP